MHDASWATRQAAGTELFEYIEVFYNGQRRHSSLGGAADTVVPTPRGATSADPAG